jgi:DNA-binding SARP family transcriptional activator
MRFRILGQLEVFDGNHWRGLGAARGRSLLAALLIRANHVVPVDQLIFELWGDTPPKTAPTQIHGYVMRLRRAIGDPGVLRTAPSGYRLVIGTADLDASAFAELAEQGQTAKDAELLNGALALWRGPALADIPPTTLVAAEANRLTELRLTAWEARVDADLERGRHAAVVGELAGHVKEHPLRERAWRQLMLALYRSGRQVEALRTYQQLRDTLVEEIGVEPCPAVQQLHQRILTEHAGEAGPCQLPAGIPDFTGRTEPLATLARLLDDRRADRPAPIAVLFGGPGVGKSTLAVHAARAASAAFPDGQLYLDLTGTAATPREPAVLLADLLRALGISDVPDSVPARETRYRSLLAGRRFLLVLDDAARADQVRSLLPPTGGSAVLVTSRRLLTDLAGARHIEVDAFSPKESRQLFASIVGADRVAREPAAAEAISGSCGQLPLAIRIAAGKLVGRPAWPLRILQERLAERSLGELRLGELDVRESFERSVRLLPDEASRAFRLLGLLSTRSVPGWVAGPLLDRRRADDVLDALVDANLLRLMATDASDQPHYRLPDLLRAYAAECAAAIPADERAAAIGRVLAAGSRRGELFAPRRLAATAG